MAFIGKKLGAFIAETYQGGAFKTITEADVLGKWSIFFFYPADFTFVCPTELGDLQDKYAELKELGVEVYGVSTDTHFVHKAWHDASETIRKVEYPLVGVPNWQLSKQFGVLIEEAGLANRGTFVLNPEGEVKVLEVTDGSIGRNAEELVRKVKAAQFVAEHGGEVCPANWKPGDATLKPGLDLVGKI